MKKTLFLGMTILVIGAVLTACGALKQEKTGSAAPESSQTQEADSASKDMGDTSASKEEQMPDNDTDQVVHGTINMIDTYLVLLTEEGNYQIMDYGEGVTVDQFTEGDTVDITYTGTLGDEKENPVITNIVLSK